ncbi:MAG TPA: ArsJ-associated glyceraldehyde-3-phosphate dehydrogenase [Rhodobacterales bacterium]|nr:ArsJ-associated glyceraldehyde-3-phosphate dehydrogenase [Rhodobacterales bacterium]
MTRIAINGLGRIGKLVLRDLVDSGVPGEIVLLNDAIGTPEQHAHLFEFDTVHGRWNADISAGDSGVTINGTRMALTRLRAIDQLPLAELDIDVVIDCTGAFRTADALAPYFAAGVKKVVVSAPVKDEAAANIVYGVNHQIYSGQSIVTAASCTTNCLAPVVKVIQEGLGIRHGMITTLHDVTNTQTIVDRPAKDLRRARSALNSLIPTTTGSAKAITQIFPELTGRLNGHAVRVPLLNASLTDCVFEVAHETSVEEVNALLQAAAEGPLEGILGFETRPLVSADYVNDNRSSIVDAPSTMVTNGTQVKIYAWYDNEWGYACRLGDVARMVMESL